MTTTDYRNFLESKIVHVARSGFDVSDHDLHPDNFPHQIDAIRWAANLGKALVAMSFGLGKTRIQCELARLIYRHTGKPFLIICPLGVKHQFQEEDGPRLGMTWQYIRTDAEFLASESPYLITNYERVRDGNITGATIDQLAGVSLDEGSVLRSLGSKTSQTFKELFANTEYRYVCTATPAPNDYKELIYYAEFLGAMDHGQALTRWFKRDSAKAGHLTLHPHHERDFWMWVAGWGLFLFTPSDLGHSDDGYILPPMQINWHRIAVDQSRAWNQVDNRGQHRLILDAAGGVREASAEKRETLPERLASMQQIMAANPDRHWLLWHHLERERDAIERAIPEAVTVYGSQDLETREAHILGFVRGEFPILATKPEIAGSGCNFQRHCYSNIFLGVDYKFQDFIQAIHRTYRFQQSQPVDVHIIYAESEDAVVDVLKRKWQQHNELVEKMRAIIRKYGLSHEAMKRDLVRTIGVHRMDVKGKLFTAVNNDCVIETRTMPDNYAGLIHTSIPFGNHYEYTAQVEDFGHNPTGADFWQQMEYLIPELLRILKPGRVAAIHVKDRILYGHQTPSGFMEVAPFSDECVMAFRKHGWLYEGRRTIVTDVVRENASTYRLGWTEMTKDASKMGSGLPEYLLLFRKPPSQSENAYADEPVTKRKSEYTRARWQVDAHAFWRSNGNTPLYPQELYDYESHIARLEEKDRAGNLPASFFYEPPKSNSDHVWDDVIYMRTLNTEQSQKRRENHICPLPFDIVERTIRLYSNEGDIVLDPFAGLFTVPYSAIKMRRIGHGIELNSAYFNAGVRYCKDIEEQVTAPTLFDYLEIPAD
ncbi:MAG TPA: DNA methyltransferase [Dissulfurispiraceae bacterium]|nr:DNA methyltransferase [Dissulfurispiraceae bacterium]